MLASSALRRSATALRLVNLCVIHTMLAAMMQCNNEAAYKLVACTVPFGRCGQPTLRSMLRQQRAHCFLPRAFAATHKMLGAWSDEAVIWMP